MQLENKLSKLKRILLKCNSCLIAFSGGSDSTFLLKVASSILPKSKILSVTANSATYPKSELLFAREICRKIGVRHEVIHTQELSNKKFISNTRMRCYFCKKELFSRLISIARKNNIKYVLDASNDSDKTDFRPGAKAKLEAGVRSPLEEAGITKNDIRALSRKLGLVTWDKPAQACLASRIPYGVRISIPILKRVNKAEAAVRKLRFKQVRVRHYNGLCRIEVAKEEIPRLIMKSQAIVDKLKKLGYNYVTLDLEGYRIGSLNEVIKK